MIFYWLYFIHKFKLNYHSLIYPCLTPILAYNNVATTIANSSYI